MHITGICLTVKKENRARRGNLWSSLFFLFYLSLVLSIENWFEEEKMRER